MTICPKKNLICPVHNYDICCLFMLIQFSSYPWPYPTSKDSLFAACSQQQLDKIQRVVNRSSHIQWQMLAVRSHENENARDWRQSLLCSLSFGAVFFIFMIHVVCSCCWPNPTSKAGKFLIACTDGHACVVVCSSITIKLCSRLCSHAIRFSWQQPAPVNCSTSTSMLSMSIWHLFSGTFLYGR